MGLATWVQLAPSQCKVRVSPGPGKVRLRPTAHMSSAATALTSPRELADVPGLGLGTTAQALPFVRAVAANDSELVITLDDPDAQNPLLIQALMAAGALIRYVEPIEHSLEDVYLELVQDNI